MDNKELMKKADLALADLADGGLLNAEQSNTFIRKLITQPNIINGNKIRFVPMNSPQKKIEKIGFGKRILRAATAGTALATAAIDSTTFNGVTEATARAKPQMETVTLVTKEVIADVPLPYDVMEDNIERAAAANNENMNDGPGGLRTTILELIAERASTDLEELAILGNEDLGTGDTYLQLMDGWLVNASENGNTVDFGGATVSKALFKAGLKAMPDKYKRDVGSLANFVNMDNELEYRDTLSDRGTGMGDRYVTTNDAAVAYGTTVNGVSLMPAAQGLLTNPKNLIMGVQRQVSLEFDKNIRTREYIIVLTARIDFKIEEAEAIVHYSNIGTA